MKPLIYILLCCFFTNVYCQNLSSPDKNISLSFMLNDGRPMYSIAYKDKDVIKKSYLGLIAKTAALTDGFVVANIEFTTFDENWKPVLGEYNTIRNHYNQMVVTLKQSASEIELRLVFRLFDAGASFRYEIKGQKNIGYFELTDEITEFRIAGDHKTFWIQGDYDSQEYIYQETKFSAIDVDKVLKNNGVGLQSIGGRYMIQSPVMMKTEDGLYLNIFEAAVQNYPVMHLRADITELSMTCALTPNAVGSKAFLRTPFASPWRTIIVSDDARKVLAANTMILNLNEPSKIKDVSWIKPIKYVGIWWEMHIGKSTWDYANTQNMYTWDNPSEMTPNGKHGATTENTKRYIDFADRHGFDAVLVEGWNIGWEDWYGKWKEDVFDFITPYPDFDIAEVSRYARSKGIKMIMHHETSGSASNYERWLDRAIAVMKKYDYPGVKTGYVGRIIPRGEYHDGQTMVNHYHHVVQRMAENQLMINSHESSRPTGMHRTYPNYIAAEAARGNEFNAWSNGNPPMHETILPFTRLMGGPMDYTPGIFEIKMEAYGRSKEIQVHTTLAKQLALYVTMYSPIQMAADLPENYDKYPDAFQFIKDVAADWDDTKILEAEPGDYLTIARKAKGKNDWFLGAITDENSRKTTVNLDFLDPGKTYTATIYEDGKDADWKLNPASYSIRRMEVTSLSVLPLQLANGGGTAVSLVLKTRTKE